MVDAITSVVVREHAVDQDFVISEIKTYISGRDFAEQNKLKIRATIKGRAVTGVDWRRMGMGPLPATEKVLAKTGLSMDKIDVIELNEAFASQSVAVTRELGLDPSKVNVNGGAIALGHPLGCTGTKLTVQLLDELRFRKGKYGIVTMCVGTGQGAAGVFELLK